ncbi:SDR family oxidoreductase [Paenibacillus glycinis]|uniref:SDR family NAD(P)-dependent oxidoreductase n=1 Tax=Paenibacillus glycinis TaxID=2697035 RepID=A0ABW9XYR0_9BACL|nr:SDR family oxidoreductase [Paenibacillus glycinis]NBD27864.1 SDR family NAD(P)-dependent oxidoreductase [Paenibacillus glycinis]
MENVKAKVIIITGASSGIGEATARLLAKNGAKVVLAARRVERLQVIANEIKQEGGDAIYIATDVTSAGSMQELAQFALTHYGRIDVLVNNAGVMLNTHLNELNVQDWDQMIDVNIKGVLYGIAAVLPTMRAQKAGHVINLSSVAGHHVSPSSAVYSATKFAVRAISEGLRQEESPASNIRTTIISPGLTDTDLIPTEISNPEIKALVEQLKGMAISPYSIARAIAYAVNEPADAAVNEMIIRPTLLP